MDEIRLFKPKAHRDERGTFREVYNAKDENSLAQFFPYGIKQISQSFSETNVFRGLHLQYRPWMAKGMQVIDGAAHVFTVDMRPSSDAYLKLTTHLLGPSSGILYAPGWYARGFLTLRPTVMQYYQDAPYNPDSAITISYDGLIEWEGPPPVMSGGDARGMSVVEWERLYRLTFSHE